MAAAHARSYAEQLATAKRDFLDTVNAGKAAEDWVVAVGNEAGDLDSVASALGYAHFAAQREPTSSGRRFVPLVLTARADLHLRPENELALQDARVPKDALLTLDDLPASRLASLGARFALVDHNSLLPLFRTKPDDLFYAADDARVSSIVDHHVDEGRHPAAKPRRIELVGSCASLITNTFLAKDVAGQLDVPTPLADLLLSSIMIDTRLKPAADGGKATPIDVDAANVLLPFSSFAALSAAAANGVSTSSSTGALDALKAHNDRLSHAKEDVSHLSARDLLRRDYKEYLVAGVRYGLSTVPLSLSVLLDAPPAPADRVDQLVRDVRAWMDERGLDMAGVLTSYMQVKKSGKEGKHRREFMLIVRGDAALQGVFPLLEADDVLRLEEWKDASEYGVQRGEDGRERWCIWQQGNDRATRKQVAPSLKSAVEQAVGGAAGP